MEFRDASGVRSHVRVIPHDSVQGAADAQLAQQVGARRAFVLDDGTEYGAGIARRRSGSG
jgi:ABC-type branched-subunit amino acid transport system substrate-binding protein